MSLINKRYINKYDFELEKQVIFKESWILVGHKSELTNHNDFLSFSYLGEKFFIQNYRGEIKAFQNICLHRFNLIHSKDFGNRASSCLYHHWSYNKDGNVGSMSCKNSFEECQISDLKLKEFEVQTCGDFVFIKLIPDNKLSLNEYLGDMFGKLCEFSEHLGSKIIDYKIEHDGNWKLLVENVLECYHCLSVHENSFAKMGYGFNKPESFSHFNAHSWCEFPKKKGVIENKKIEEVLSSRTNKSNGYIHFFVYPNAFVSSVEGKGFYIGFMIPEAPERTILRVRYFAPKLQNTLSESNQNIFDFIMETSKDSLDIVLNEDKTVINNIQSNLSLIQDSMPIFGTEEFRINNFYDYFNLKLNENEQSV